MLSLALWLLVGCGIAVFLFYVGSVLLQILGSVFELLFDEECGPVFWGIIVIVSLVVCLLFI